MRVKLPSLTSVLEETSEAEGVDYTFPFSVFTFPLYSIPLSTSAFITSFITSKLVGSP